MFHWCVLLFLFWNFVPGAAFVGASLVILLTYRKAFKWDGCFIGFSSKVNYSLVWHF